MFVAKNDRFEWRTPVCQWAQACTGRRKGAADIFWASFTLSKWKERPSCLPPTFCATTTSRALSLQVITCCTPFATSSLLRGLHFSSLSPACPASVQASFYCHHAVKK